MTILRNLEDSDCDISIVRDGNNKITIGSSVQVVVSPIDGAPVGGHVISVSSPKKTAGMKPPVSPNPPTRSPIRAHNRFHTGCCDSKKIKNNSSEDIREKSAISLQKMKTKSKTNLLANKNEVPHNLPLGNDRTIQSLSQDLIKASKDQKPSCQYGSNCYRKNPDHLQNFSHPGDGDMGNTPIGGPLNNLEALLKNKSTASISEGLFRGDNQVLSSFDSATLAMAVHEAQSIVSLTSIPNLQDCTIKLEGSTKYSSMELQAILYLVVSHGTELHMDKIEIKDGSSHTLEMIGLLGQWIQNQQMTPQIKLKNLVMLRSEYRLIDDEVKENVMEGFRRVTQCTHIKMENQKLGSLHVEIIKSVGRLADKHEVQNLCLTGSNLRQVDTEALTLAAPAVNVLNLKSAKLTQEQLTSILLAIPTKRPLKLKHLILDLIDLTRLDSSILTWGVTAVKVVEMNGAILTNDQVEFMLYDIINSESEIIRLCLEDSVILDGDWQDKQQLLYKCNKKIRIDGNYKCCL